MHPLYLTKEQLQIMIDHVNAEAPLEACGLLAGIDSSVEKIFLVQNQAHSPIRYVMNPQEQLNAFAWIESHRMNLLGIFHSHPTGPETVSPTDIDEAAYEVIQVILSRMDAGWRARGFWIKDNDYSEIELRVR